MEGASSTGVVQLVRGVSGGGGGGAGQLYSRESVLALRRILEDYLEIEGGPNCPV